MLHQLRFTARLKLLSDIHIGTGDSKKLSELRPGAYLTEGTEHDPEVATIFRIECGAGKIPALPATAIKGVLRNAILQLHGDEEAKRLFGEIKNTETGRIDGEAIQIDSGKVGTIWLRLAKLETPPSNPDALPFWDDDANSFISTHVAIDRETGAAAYQKLFSVERVPEGAEFKLRGIAIGERNVCVADILKALGPLATSDGLSLGAGERFGSGRVQIVGEVSCRRWWFDTETGDVVNNEAFTLPVAREAVFNQPEAKTFDLYCRGPYLTVDPAPARQSTNDGENRKIIRAARRMEESPLLPATSLIGALRSRAAWLAAIDDIGDGDEPFRKPDSWAHPEDLSRVERLFGVSGWRGLVRVISIEPQDETPPPQLKEMSCVAIDRFTGGFLDSMLYTIEAFTGAGFRIKLVLDKRYAANQTWPGPADNELFNELLMDMERDGLHLGHGSNRGFGWFTAKEIIAS